MAKKISRSNRHRYIRFTDQYGNQQSLQLGVCKNSAETRASRAVKYLVLLALPEPCNEQTREWLNMKTIEWLSGEGSRCTDQLAAFGLLSNRPLTIRS